MSVGLEDNVHFIASHDSIQPTSSMTMDPMSVDITDANSLSSPPKLKPLIIPEQGSVALLGLLTPVDETPDDAEPTHHIHRRLPVPMGEIKTNRPRARSWATWTTESRTPISANRAVHPESSGGRFFNKEKSLSALENPVDRSQTSRNTTEVSPIRGISRAGTREGRSFTISHVTDATTIRISTPKLAQRSTLPSPPERPFISRARANTSVPVSRHHVQNWIASPIATPSPRLAVQYTQSRVKALPKVPVTSDIVDQERHPRLTDKGKGKERSPDVVSESVVRRDKNSAKYGLLTPPVSAKTLGGAGSSASTLSGLRGIRPKGPRTRRSTIC
ncbi:hypothetical protein BDP27DRAFT_1441000 [Rhodocollybia butyracea]|uniref:Uncharacterized protein n=1 Tax=Rhodocollybia butyracea TaxID=206335 RepID=A0A9P5QBU8_9AGAR|nr:hypothetical protein BDP27DRAFT_1441000 [Rhodocollybia butyracea]